MKKKYLYEVLLKCQGFIATFKKNKTFQIVSGVFVVSLFLSGLIYSVYNQPDVFKNLNALPFIGIILGVGTIFIISSAYELQLMAKLSKCSLSLKDALKTSVLSSFFNMLPIPGAIIVKTAKLKQMGIGLKDIGILMSIISLMSFLIGAVYSSLFLLVYSTKGTEYFFLLSILLFIGSTASLIILCLVFQKIYKKFFAILTLLTLRFFMTFAGAIGICLSFQAMGIYINFIQASLLIFSWSIGAILIVFQGGLGIVETASATIAYFINLSPESAYLASTIYRFGTYITIFLFLFILWITKNYDIKTLKKNN